MMRPGIYHDNAMGNGGHLIQMVTADHHATSRGRPLFHDGPQGDYSHRIKGIGGLVKHDKSRLMLKRPS